MNAKQMIAKLDGYGGIIPFNSEELDVTLRALRLLDAAEGGEGTPDRTDEERANPAIYISRLERKCTGLATRVLELERGIAIATDRLTGPGGVLSAIDAARSAP